MSNYASFYNASNNNALDDDSNDILNRMPSISQYQSQDSDDSGSDIDDDIFRDEDAFTSEDEDTEQMFSEEFDETLRQNFARQVSPSFKKTLQKRMSEASIGAKSKLTYKSVMSKLSKAEIKLIEQPDRPLAGTLLYVCYTVFYSLNFLAAQLLYERNP